MTPELRAQILEALWPQGAKSKLSVWGILDCARDPKVYLALLDSKLEFRCLYSGKLPRALEQVAPHLVELSPGNRLTSLWLDEAWGQAWGILVKIDDPSNLRHHLRKFLKVQDEQGRSLIFRFYDPRVLRAYLPTCVAAELKQMFGPLQAFLAEGPDGASIDEYRFNGAHLQSLQAPIPAPAPGA